jgi:hypothetical protein
MLQDICLKSGVAGSDNFPKMVRKWRRLLGTDCTSASGNSAPRPFAPSAFANPSQAQFRLETWNGPMALVSPGTHGVRHLWCHVTVVEI